MFRWLQLDSLILSNYTYLPSTSVGWFIILVFTTSAGVPIVAATNPAQPLWDKYKIKKYKYFILNF